MAAAATTASIVLRCGGGKAFLCGEGRAAGGDSAFGGSPGALCLSRSSLVPKRRCAVKAVLAAPPSPGRHRNIAASSSVWADPFAQVAVGNSARGRQGREPVSPEKLDEWMRDSVVEIVKNIGEAPFLVHVFSNDNNSSNTGGSSGLTLQREAADAETWPDIRRRWSTGTVLPPDGVILVEELAGEEGMDGEDGEDASCCSGCSDAGAASKTWGVVVQGRGTDRAACYILNTCRVQSTFGFCTHFCLAKAKCFGETADVQLKKAWLLGGKHHLQQ